MAAEAAAVAYKAATRQCAAGTVRRLLRATEMALAVA